MKKILSKFIGFYLNLLTVVAPKKAGRLSFNLFCRPFRLKMTKRQLEFLQSAELFELLHRGEVIQGYRWGTGSKNVLMLHGWQSHTYRWKAYVDSIDKNEYSVFAIDAPGHGLSSGQFLTVPLYSEGVRLAIHQIGKLHSVVGHSLGGFTAIYTFSHHPELMPDKLVVMASPGEAVEFFQFYEEQLGLSSKCVEETVKRFEEVVQKSPEYFSAANFAKQLSTHGLIIHDEEDLETSVKNSRSIHQSWPNSRLIVTKGKGHNLKSPEVVRDVVSFIDQLNDELAVTKLQLNLN